MPMPTALTTEQIRAIGEALLSDIQTQSAGMLEGVRAFWARIEASSTGNTAPGAVVPAPTATPATSEAPSAPATEAYHQPL